jgi:uncharacterized protein (TIGR02284 family)
MKFESTKLNFNVMSELSQKIRQLNQLLIINNNAEKAYLEALEIANDEGLKQFFRARAFERSEFCRYLGAEIRVLGGEPSYAGEVDSAHRINWPDFKGILATNNARKLFSEINRIKGLCLIHYNSVLNNYEFPESLVRLLKKQRKIIGSSISFIRYRDGVTAKRIAMVSGQ